MAAPGGSSVGPFPATVTTDDEQIEYDKMRRRLLWKMPSGLYVIGSRAGERRNAMTLNWCTQVSFEPKLIGIGVEKTAFTHDLITEGGAFAMNLIARDDRAIVRKFTKPVDVDVATMTLNGFTFTDGVTGSPILANAVGYLDCEVRQAVDVGGHTFFIGEVVDSAFQSDEDVDVLRMEDTRMNYGG